MGTAIQAMKTVLIALALTAAMAIGASAQIISPIPLPTPAPAAQEPAPAAEEPGLEAYGELEPGLMSYEQLSQAPDIMVEVTQSKFESWASSLRERLADAPFLFMDIEAAMRAKSPTGQASYFLTLIAATAAAIALAFPIVSIIYGVWLLRPWFVSKKRANPQGYLEKLPILALRALLGVGGILLSAALAVLLLRLYWGPISSPEAQKTVIIVMTTFALARLVGLVWRVVLAPYLSEYRLPVMSDRDARVLFHWLWATGAIAVAGPGVTTFLAMIETPENTMAVARLLVGLITAMTNILLVWRTYSIVGAAILSGKPREAATWPARFAASGWGAIVISYVLTALAFTAVRHLEMLPAGPPLIASGWLVLATVIVVYGATLYAIEWVFLPRRATLEPDEPSEETSDAASEASADGSASVSEAAPRRRRPRARMKTLRDLANRVATIFAMCAGLYAVGWVWGAIETLNNTPKFWPIVDIGATLLIAYIVYHAFRIWIDQKIEEEGGLDGPLTPGEGEGGGAGASRLATLLPLFRNFVLSIVAISVLVFVALELGVNVAPLFAGAGIVGIALGFGAQALVRDILSGAFFLVDDAFRKGEYIDIGSVKGIVEKISVRSFQLRHHLGYLHTVPFGEIQFLTNYSRDWVIMKLPLRLTYDTDAEVVRKKIKTLGEELLKHPVYGERFLQPLKSQGVIQMEDSAMIMRVKFMTKPGEQWEIRKLVYKEIRELFEREGIKFAHREVTVRIADDGGKDLTEAQRNAVGAAARRTTDNAQRQDEFFDDGPGGD